ncbi:MAG: hypothetical protein P1S46_11315 [bacterium]|nr:hypothetical protein [bacterium]MDT8396772.1 hypothetical protein [bacterium]
MTSETLNDPVVVGAIFGHGAKVSPAWFVFGGRKVKVSGVNHVWIERQGLATLHHFSVSDGPDTFHLVMNSETLSWHIEGISLP